MLFDTHAHLFKTYYNNLDSVLHEAKNNLVENIMIVGYNAETNLETIKICQEHKNLYPAIGIHPNELTDYKNSLINLEKLIDENIYAIGECGLDFYWHKDNVELQSFVFIEQIKLAIKYKKPLIVHMRDATEKTYEILRKFKGEITGVMHCFSGSLEMAEKFIDLGFYISFGGPVTFKNAIEPKRIASKIDLEKLLIETDSPYLAPMPFRGKQNSPALLKNIAMEIAILRNITLEEVMEATTKNALKLFKIKK